MAFARTPQNASEILDQRIEMQVINGTLLQALSTLAVNNRVPIGFEPCLCSRDPGDLTVDRTASLREILDLIVRQRPSYRWQAIDGVINFIPVAHRDEFVTKILELRVNKFDPGDWRNQFNLRDAIVALPEVQSALEADGVVASRNGYFYRAPDKFTRAELKTSNVQVRQLLNSIIRETPYRMWIVSRSGPERKVLDVGL
jgi:hypothetical protein